MDEINEFAPHVEDIVRALKNKVENKVIEEELNNYVSVYRIPLEQAKRSIVKKYDGDLGELSVGVLKKISELRMDEPNVDLLCRVVAVNEKEISVEGNPKKIFFGI